MPRIVVFFFLGSLRSTLIAAVAIPVSIVSTYTLLLWMGFTLNTLSLLALTLAVGIVIDDAIVVLENIFRFIEEKGMSPMVAAKAATAEVGLAVSATTLSLVVIFVPVAFIHSVTGRFLNTFGLTMAFSIMVSLLVAFTLTPMLCSRFLKHTKAERTSRDSWFFSAIEAPLRARAQLVARPSMGDRLDRGSAGTVDPGARQNRRRQLYAAGGLQRIRDQLPHAAGLFARAYRLDRARDGSTRPRHSRGSSHVHDGRRYHRRRQRDGRADRREARANQSAPPLHNSR